MASFHRYFGTSYFDTCVAAFNHPSSANCESSRHITLLRHIYDSQWHNNHHHSSLIDSKRCDIWLSKLDTNEYEIEILPPPPSPSIFQSVRRHSAIAFDGQY